MNENKKIIGILSCKGGVGKSTLAVNIAVFLAYYYKKKIGLLDADIHGPNHTNILNSKYTIENNMNDSFFTPLNIYNLKSMSLGYFLNKNSSVLLRGPMVSNTIKHLFEKTKWGDTECFIIDFPPGTGDIYLSLLRDIIFDGILLITTPNSLAIDDLRRSISMLQKFNINVYGLIENMQYYTCPNCNKIDYVYGENKNVLNLIDEFKIKKHYKLPIDTKISANSSKKPFVLSNIKSQSYNEIEKISNDLLRDICI
ncbi:MAG: P-loop NTPase [Candidatus Riesia sp.]|nr:P-loop NTPase [Candidatus Riesia sp.]